MLIKINESLLQRATDGLGRRVRTARKQQSHGGLYIAQVWTRHVRGEQSTFETCAMKTGSEMIQATRLEE